MDPTTLQCYDSHATDFAARYESVSSPVAPYFPTAFPAGARVLDIGAGSGRDLAALLAAGCDAWGVEPSEGLRSAAQTAHPELSGRLTAGALPEIGTPFGGGFDGILCSAVLMHLPDSELFDAALALRRLLRRNGRLLLSLPSARTDVGPDHRDAQGRLFSPHGPDELQLLFERLGFEHIGRWDTEDALARAGTRWYTLLFELRANGALRAVDQIEGILNRDRKVATYKFALFRALAEIATQESRSVRWLHDGEVAVAIDRIAHRWLGYYWPLVASARHIPQSQAEGTQGGAPLMFRTALQALIDAHKGQGEHGGLSAWQATLGAGRQTAEVQALQAAALKSIAVAIQRGPVAYAGGALEGGTVFRYDGRTRSVVMSAALWRELNLLGHWITDAVVLRWAALTERFAWRQGLSAGDVLPLLLAKPDVGRSTATARSIYLQTPELRCVWTGRPLSNQALAVDHLIPHALWGNNDLWNLLPAHKAVNGAKSDRLPEADLMATQRPLIEENWTRLRDALPVAFDRQASSVVDRLAGPSWTGTLFCKVKEAVELTAIQRGVVRWRPTQGQPSASSGP